MVAFPKIKPRMYAEFVFKKGIENPEIFVIRYKPGRRYEKLTRMKLMEWADNPEINLTLLDVQYISRAMVSAKRKSPKDIASCL
jgi:hypothetical protein